MRATRTAAVITVLGVLAVSAGVFGQFGVWWGLITAGTLAAGGGLTLIRVDDPDREARK
jgi:hypothetical protein